MAAANFRGERVSREGGDAAALQSGRRAPFTSLDDWLASKGVSTTAAKTGGIRALGSAFSIQIHGLTDAPYFSASTRIRVYLATPRCPRGASSDRTGTQSLNLISCHRSPPVDPRRIGPLLEACQSDASECSAPWFSSDEGFVFVDSPDIVSDRTVVAIAVVDVIDRRNLQTAVGCIGASIIHIHGRDGVHSLPLFRSVAFDPKTETLSVTCRNPDDRVPIVGLVVEVHSTASGSEVSPSPNVVAAKKLRAIMFGALKLESHVSIATCMSPAEELSREDRRLMLYRNGPFRTLRPIDIGIHAAVAKSRFELLDSIAPDPALPLQLCEKLDELGLHVFNPKRGACITIHGLLDPDPLPVTTAETGAVKSRRASSAEAGIIVPSSDVALAIAFKVVVEANGVIVGFTSIHDWDAPLTGPRFPARSNSFILSYDTMIDDNDEENEEGRTSAQHVPRRVVVREPVPLDDDKDETYGDALIGDIGGDATFQDLGELEGVTCILRVYAMVPKYPKSQPMQRSAKRPLSQGEVMASFPGFSPSNPAHFVVIPYAWTVVDAVTPNRPFINMRRWDTLPLYKGAPPADVLSALKPVLRKFGESSRVRKKPTLEDVMAPLQGEGRWPVPMQARLQASVLDVSYLHSSLLASQQRSAPLDQASLRHVTLASAFLGPISPCTVAQAEECMEATFREWIFQ